MIIFDRFLCCISLKTFGKFLGWVGTTGSAMTAYAGFLVASGRKSAGDNVSKHMIYGNNLSIDDFYYYTGLLIALLVFFAAIHIMLICGIKFLKSLLIVPYILLAVVTTASLICILPSEIHLSSSSEHEATNPYLIIACIFTLIFSVYITLCIYSLYEIIKFEEKRRKFYQNPDTILIAPLPLKGSY